MTGGYGLSLNLHQSIAEIPAADWDLCAGAENPFLSHAFLSAIEDSGSTGRQAGWIPWHAAVRDRAGVIQAVVPLYEKTHSYGEYVFDHAWAQAFERVGGHYYPKLVCAVPFTPVPGARLLCRPGINPGPLAGALIEACRQFQHSSLHINFCTEAEVAALAPQGFLPRIGVQYHWHNQGWADFEGFLGALSSRKRKSIRRERAAAQGSGLRFATLQGGEIKPGHWDAFYRFYLYTIDRKWGSPYLTRGFFPLLSERLGDRVVLMMAFEGETPVAGALNLRGSEALYGRNWGASGDYPFLHFELCYYQAIDFALRHGLARVEAGAQGEHKIQRGYLPVKTHSLHWFAHAGLGRAVADYLDHERVAIEGQMAELGGYSPFKEE